MSLLDFLRGKRATGEKSVTTVYERGGMKATLTVTASRGPSCSPDGPEPDFPMPKNTLRDLKAYSERVAHPCGFDFSAARRRNGRPGEWWLDGANYEKACEALMSLLPFEEQARSELPGFPRAIERMIDHSVPCARGADGNLVPYVARDTTKKRGTVIAAHFSVKLTENGPTTSATVYFGDDGRVTEARVSHYDRWNTGDWSFRVDTPKRTGVLTYKGCSYTDPKE